MYRVVQKTKPVFKESSLKRRKTFYEAIAGREYVSICKNRALCDNNLELCMVLGMAMSFSKTTAHKLGETPGGR